MFSFDIQTVMFSIGFFIVYFLARPWFACVADFSLICCFSQCLQLTSFKQNYCDMTDDLESDGFNVDEITDRLSF